MTPTAVIEQYRQLRQELVRHGGEHALPPIEGLRLPTRDDDELSFMRLVVWAYALLQENGRVPLRFLRELGRLPKAPVVESVMALRAWMTHNLSLASGSDQQRMNIARVWFRGACGRHVNLEHQDWKKCLDALCSELFEMLRQALEATSILDDAVDGPRNVEELKRRVSKSWEAHAFDPFLRTSADRLGFDDLDVVAFRTRHLAQWRRVIEVAEDGLIERLLAQRIEADLLEWFGGALPLTAREVLAVIPLSPSELGTLLLAVRAKSPVTRQSLMSVLQDLSGKLESEPSKVESKSAVD